MELIGRYQVKGELGRGGFGGVYLAWDPAVGREVAIKLLTGEGPGVVGRFRSEAAITGRLKHPNVVTVYDSGEHEGRPFLVMERLEGVSLRQAIDIGTPLLLSEKVRILTAIAQGLAYAHEQGVVHRDIKAANVMILTSGEVKVLDFGISRLLESDATRLTGAGMLVGTPQYMAPELFDGQDATPRTDQFSFGALSYELIAGRHPFDAPTLAAVCQLVVSRVPESLRKAVPDSPPELDAVVQRALAKSAQDRYASMRELLLDLSAIEKALQRHRLDSMAADAEALLRTGRNEEARAMVAQALAVDPTDVRHQTLRRQVESGAVEGKMPVKRVWMYVVAAIVVLATVVLWMKQRAAPAAQVASPPPAVGQQAPPPKQNARDGLNYVWIAPGEFQMGCSPKDEECEPAEKPAHRVVLTHGFWMGKTEVTQQAWQQVMGDAPSNFKGPNRPVEQISWDRARQYCQAIGMRLPTEAEWEYAARAGSPLSRYDDLDMVAWHTFNSGDVTHDVGGKRPNAFGLYDMYGNVMEWVEDWYGPYLSQSRTDPKGPPDGKERTLRGGAVFEYPKYGRASWRQGTEGYHTAIYYGVRCAGD